MRLTIESVFIETSRKLRPGSWCVERKVKFIERKKILREKKYEIFRRQRKKVSKGREWSFNQKVQITTIMKEC